MGRNRKTYSEAFKQKVGTEALRNENGGKTIAQIAAEFEVSPSMVCEWKKKVAKGSSKELTQAKKQIAELESKVELLNQLLGEKTFECELLKKNGPSQKD